MIDPMLFAANVEIARLTHELADRWRERDEARAKLQRTREALAIARAELARRSHVVIDVIERVWKETA